MVEIVMGLGMEALLTLVTVSRFLIVSQRASLVVLRSHLVQEGVVEALSEKHRNIYSYWARKLTRP